MKTYKSHKTVEASKIIAFERSPHPGWAALTLEGGVTLEKPAAWVLKHSNNGAIDLAGGYFVRYADGYDSWSPAEAFEEGYSEVVAS